MKFTNAYIFIDGRKFEIASIVVVIVSISVYSNKVVKQLTILKLSNEI